MAEVGTAVKEGCAIARMFDGQPLYLALLFEVRYEGVPVNPRRFLSASGRLTVTEDVLAWFREKDLELRRAEWTIRNHEERIRSFEQSIDTLEAELNGPDDAAPGEKELNATRLRMYKADLEQWKTMLEAEKAAFPRLRSQLSAIETDLGDEMTKQQRAMAMHRDRLAKMYEEAAEDAKGDALAGRIQDVSRLIAEEREQARAEEVRPTAMPADTEPKTADGGA